MKLKELMFDDYVSFDNKVWQIQDLVAYGSYYPITLYNSETDAVRLLKHTEVELLEPVPITADILKDYGFEEKEGKNGILEYHFFNPEPDGRTFVDLVAPHTWPPQIYEWVTGNGCCIQTICFVHELQHILRLLHIKREIRINEQ